LLYLPEVRLFDGEYEEKYFLRNEVQAVGYRIIFITPHDISMAFIKIMGIGGRTRIVNPVQYARFHLFLIFEVNLKINHAILR